MNIAPMISCSDCQEKWEGYCPLCKKDKITAPKLHPLAINSSKRKKKVAVFEKSNGICGICNEPVKFESMSIDHIIPKSKGGSDNLDNLQASHYECNHKKGNKIITTIGEIAKISNL